MEEQLRETESSIDNIISMIEKGVASDRLAKRLTQLEKDQKDLQKRLDRERKSVVILEKPIVIHWLKQFSRGDIEEDSFRRQLIDLLVNSVTVWDEPDGWFKITTVYNLLQNNRKTIKVKMPPTPSATTGSGGSDLGPVGSPRRSKVRFAPALFYAHAQKSVIRPPPCSSFPDRNRLRWVAIWVGAQT